MEKAYSFVYSAKSRESLDRNVDDKRRLVKPARKLLIGVF
jgi:hypothetical protein